MSVRGDIEFRAVRFGYERRRPTLPHVSFRVRRGEKVGIVGASGSGKSTIIQLIQRLHDTQGGEILIDGRSIKSLSQATLRNALSVVPQEISLFHRSVMDNIRFARPEATDAQVRAAATAACCDEFLASLPHGFDTMVGERGVKLSGGRRQRIGIARAFLKAAPILLLDEATSALDTALELRIHANIDRLLTGRTIIAVAHRLSSLTSFDRVLVMNQGEIVEQGSPAALRRRGTLFNHLWRLQAHGLQAPSIVQFRGRER
jgi:ATP-binding cassette subfamily B protein